MSHQQIDPPTRPLGKIPLGSGPGAGLLGSDNATRVENFIDREGLCVIKGYRVQ